MSPTDSLLLLADGVYGATYQAVKLPALAERLKNKLTASRCYALQADVAMRAIEHHLVPDLQLIDDADFVKLSIAHQRTQSWN
jgi:sulfur relay protein TusB/DsrH